MIFTRTRKYPLSVSKQDFMNRLAGKHIKIHDLDFEVYDQETLLKIAPHTEYLNEIKTLPITDVDVIQEGNTNKVVLTSKIRVIDYGGPLLIMLFCTFLFCAATILFLLGGEPHITYLLFGASILVFGLFWIRMQRGYFDYVRKVENFVKAEVKSYSTTSPIMQMTPSL